MKKIIQNLILSFFIFSCSYENKKKQVSYQVHNNKIKDSIVNLSKRDSMLLIISEKSKKLIGHYELESESLSNLILNMKLKGASRSTIDSLKKVRKDMDSTHIIELKQIMSELKKVNTVTSN